MRHREGPCLDALYQEHTVRLSDMAAETRWPRFTDRAAQLSIGSMLSFQLYVEQDKLGTVNLYAHDTDGFSEESEHVGLLLPPTRLSPWPTSHNISI